MRKEIVRKQAAGAIAMVAFAVAMATTPMAGQGRDSNGDSAAVIAHLPLPGPSATQMLLERQNGKLRLYVEQAKQGVVVDVTSPGRPRVIGHVAWPGRTANGQLQLLGSRLALSELPEGRAVARGTPAAPRTVNILDTTDMEHPQVLQTFFGVTSVLPDVDRNLIFIANGEGLWIVRHGVGEKAYAMRHFCTSESAINPEPDCY